MKGRPPAVSYGHGIGISKEDRASLFQKFTQLDSSLTKKHKGAGLCLAISRELVQRMEGVIGG